jgi:hypothetical protein
VQKCPKAFRTTLVEKNFLKSKEKSSKNELSKFLEI